MRFFFVNALHNVVLAILFCTTTFVAQNLEKSRHLNGNVETKPIDIDVIVNQSIGSYHHYMNSLGTETYNATRHAEAIYLDSKFRHSLRHYGVTHIPNALSPSLVHAALKVFNKKIGRLEFAAAESPNQPKDNQFGAAGDHTDILDLFNKSFLRYIFEYMLGPRQDRYEMALGQLVPRFPDEYCPYGSTWHIDFTDVIEDSGPVLANFDALVGIQLTDSHGINSGELCTFPSSHHSLAQYYTQNPDMFRNLHKYGRLKGYPPRPRDVLGNEVYHCVGKAGDVFILNYMNAHYGNCNVSPFIRNAVYFRVWGSAYASHCREGSLTGHGNSKYGCGNQTAMLEPLIHWRI